MIKGVHYIKNSIHADERGFLQEVLHKDETFNVKFGQLNYTYVRQGVIKAWHMHQIQTDYWFVIDGALKAVLWDTREDSPSYNEVSEYLLGTYPNNGMLVIPPGVAHGLKALENTKMIYVVSEMYNPKDEGRIAHDVMVDDEVVYDWLRMDDIK